VTGSPAGRKRILIAEDDPNIAEILVRTLSPHYDVTLANNGSEALKLAENPPPPDLLLLDVMMPGLDGFGVAQRVRKLHPSRKIPIIFLTARDAPQDIITGIQHGARHYITKPFKLKDVLDRVKNLLGQ
jgi:two-component system, OmpR family, response regulator